MRANYIIVAIIALFAAVAACSSNGSQTTEKPGPAAPDERPLITAGECDARGGTIVGDIGDGAIHRPDYVCPSGKPPIGTIKPDPEGPIAVEGSVCCPAD